MRGSLVRDVFAVTLSLCLLAGCGGSVEKDLPELAQVTGTVTLDGNPVADAQVTFIPEKGPTATGRTDSAGKYVLGTKGTDDGASVGKHKVTVAKVGGPPPDATGAESYAIPDPNKPPAGGIPQKYSDMVASGLTATVEAGKENQVDLPLTSN